MAACDISQLTSDSACRTGQKLSDRDRVKMQIYVYYLIAVTEGAPVGGGGPMDLVNEARCWFTLTNDQIKAFEIQQAINAYLQLTAGATFEPTDTEMLSATACMDGLTNTQLDRILSYIKCQVLSNLPDIS